MHALEVVEGKANLFEDAIVHHNDDVFEILTLSTDSNSKTKELLNYFSLHLK